MTNVKNFLVYLFKKNIFMHSAQTAFYFLMSLFPFIYITTVILSFFSLSVVSFLDSLHYIFPSITFDVIYNNFLTMPLGFSSIRAILYSIIALWSSSMLFNSLKITFAESYPKDKLKSKILIRAISIIITIAVVFLIVCSFFITVSVGVGISFISKRLDLTQISHLVTILTTTTIFVVDMVLLYMILPPKRIKFVQAMPGAIFSTLGVSISSFCFSYYVSQIADYSKLYGTMGSVIVLLLWLYICSFVIITGGHINAYIMKTKNRT